MKAADRLAGYRTIQVIVAKEWRGAGGEGINRQLKTDNGQLTIVRRSDRGAKGQRGRGGKIMKHEIRNTKQIRRFKNFNCKTEYNILWPGYLRKAYLKKQVQKTRR